MCSLLGLTLIRVGWTYGVLVFVLCDMTLVDVFVGVCCSICLRRFLCFSFRVLCGSEAAEFLLSVRLVLYLMIA